jgi:hypothetical protein
MNLSNHDKWAIVHEFMKFITIAKRNARNAIVVIHRNYPSNSKYMEPIHGILEFIEDCYDFHYDRIVEDYLYLERDANALDLCLSRLDEGRREMELQMKEFIDRRQYIKALKGDYGPEVKQVIADVRKLSSLYDALTESN